MKIFMCAAAAMFLMSACGGEQAHVIPEEPAGFETDTLVITDSIGVLMGDSCYMIGTIAKAEALPDGKVILLDGTRGTVSLFDSNGDFVFSFGGRGEAPGEFNMPNQMTVLGDGRIIVLDAMDRELCFFSSEGEYLGSRPNSGAGGRALAMTAAGDSCFVIYSSIYKFLGDTFGMGFEVDIREGMCEEPAANLLSHLFSFPDESYDFKPGYVTIAGGENNRVYLSRMCNNDYEIEIYDIEGQPVDTIRSEPVRVNLEEMVRSPQIPIVSFMVGDGEGNNQAIYGDVPEFLPQVERMGVDSGGNLWAQRGTAVQHVIWDIFSPAGEKIREVHCSAFPDSVLLYIEVNSHGIVAWEPWPEDYPRLYRLAFK
ncbi:MAG: 6-bladed beta-propeller [Candidatus Fermentibacteria bacterium]